MQGHLYPRPQLQRTNWINLNGKWQFAIDQEGALHHPDSVHWKEEILVPFSPETPASGVNNNDLFKACWYKKTFERPELSSSERLVLNFGAVDWQATVWVNGSLAAKHEGGYTPFSCDITDFLIDGIPQTIVILAEDDPLDLEKPRGKQDWNLEPHSIWYPRTSGIWQTVWMERVPENSIRSIVWQTSVPDWQIKFTAELQKSISGNVRLSVKLSHKGEVLAHDSYMLSSSAVSRTISLPDPGIESARAELLWSPEAPNLIDVELTLCDLSGNVLDTVQSYTALRSVAVDHDRFLLNGRPYRLRMALDQGYWEETGLTPPDDAAIRLDIELAKLMKFNGVRKHQKIEDPRFLYWADFLGLLVWEEMPSAYAFSNKAVKRAMQTWTEAIERDMSHPCIVTWVPTNESWGVPDLPNRKDQRDYMQGLYYLTKSLDPTRPVVGNDGWEMLSTDIISIHDYDKLPENIAYRFEPSNGSMQNLFHNERPGGRLLRLKDEEINQQERPIVLSEFGGILFSERRDAWGYSKAETKEQFASQYKELVETVRSIPKIAGFCYTQLTDTYQEANGLLYMDRRPKISLSQIAQANCANATILEHFAETHESIEAEELHQQ